MSGIKSQEYGQRVWAW